MAPGFMYAGSSPCTLEVVRHLTTVVDKATDIVLGWTAAGDRVYTQVGCPQLAAR